MKCVSILYQLHQPLQSLQVRAYLSYVCINSTYVCFVLSIGTLQVYSACDDDMGSYSRSAVISDFYFFLYKNDILIVLEEFVYCLHQF